MQNQLKSSFSEKIYAMYSKQPSKLWLNLIINLIVIAVLVWSGSALNYRGIAKKGAEVASGIFYGLTKPDTDLLFNLTSEGVPFMLLQTVAIAFLGTLFGGILAIPFGFLASSNIVPKPVAFVVRAFVLMIRTIPSIIWALIWTRVTGPGPMCGVVTQSVCSIGMISKLYTTAIEDIDTKILESLDAQGCSTFQKIRYGILPQLTANFASTLIYRFDINIKDATILGIVGAGGIGTALMQVILSRRWSMVGSFLLAMIILMLIIEYFSTTMRKKLAQGK